MTVVVINAALKNVLKLDPSGHLENHWKEGSR